MALSHRVRKTRNNLNSQSRLMVNSKILPHKTPESQQGRARVGDSVAKASEIESLECAWYVGKRRPLSDLAFWKRWLVRAVYFTVGWCTGDGIEAQAICTSKELAEEMAKPDGWFYHELPINVSLPDQTCKFRAHVFPSSEARGKYEAMQLPIGAVKTAKIREVEQKVEQIIRSASA